MKQLHLAAKHPPQPQQLSLNIAEITPRVLNPMPVRVVLLEVEVGEHDVAATFQPGDAGLYFLRTAHLLALREASHTRLPRG